jgi:hypothetical protein
VKRIAVSAWSAGFGGLRPLLESEDVRKRVDAVFIADGMFAPLADPKLRTVYTEQIKGTFAMAEAATRSEKLFVLTHSAIPTPNYASTSETSAALLAKLGLTRTALAHESREASSEAKKGLFKLLGYDGQTVGAHIDQVKFMGDTMYKPLKQRWSQEPAPAPL